jgi:protein-S-isoprenylcysteine O-methyltransferase Ste14
MEPLVRANPVAAALVVGTLVLAGLAEWAATARTRLTEAGDDRPRDVLRTLVAAYAEVNLLRTRERGESDRNTKQILVAGIIIGLALGWLAAERVPALRMPGNPWIWFAIGLVCMWAGTALRVWGVATLGSFFRRVVVVQAGHRVVTAGPYRYLRHPAYAGNLLAYLGVGIALGNWLSIAACALIPFVAHLPRMKIEEDTLTGGLGEEYRAYMRRTARLIPRVW